MKIGDVKQVVNAQYFCNLGCCVYLKKIKGTKRFEFALESNGRMLQHDGLGS